MAWVEVFTRKLYRDMLLDGIRNCEQEKGLVVHALCIMRNHVHLVLSAKNNDVSEILRDLKKWTSKQIIKEITNK
jgi:REP element-mobilizing transposase RayT